MPCIQYMSCLECIYHLVQMDFGAISDSEEIFGALSVSDLEHGLLDTQGILHKETLVERLNLNTKNPNLSPAQVSASLFIRSH